MSENVTHVAVVEDCVMLMHASDEFSDRFKQLAKREEDFIKIASVTRSGDSFTSELLDKYAPLWREERMSKQEEARLAFVLGWLCHRAADRQMKPVFREVEPNRDYSPSNCSIYNDAFIYHRYYRNRADADYDDVVFEADMHSSPVSQRLDVQAAGEMWKSVMQGILLQQHSSVAESEDMESGVQTALKRRQRFQVNIHRYSDIFFHPKEEDEARYLEGTGFYDEKEPLLQVVSALRNGERAEPGSLKEALKAEARSHYAQILEMGYSYLRTAHDFLYGGMSYEALRQNLKIFQKGRDGKVV